MAEAQAVTTVSGKLVDLGPEIIGDLTPLQDGGVIVGLGECGADHGSDHLALAFVGGREGVWAGTDFN